MIWNEAVIDIVHKSSTVLLPNYRLLLHSLDSVSDFMKLQSNLCPTLEVPKQAHISLV